MDGEKKSLKDAFINCLDAHAEDRKAIARQRDRLDLAAKSTEAYFQVGGQIFEALQSLSEAIVARPATLSQVITGETFSISVPGQFVYAVEVIGNPKEIQLRLRRKLAELYGISVEAFAASVTIKVVGGNILIKRKVS